MLKKVSVYLMQPGQLLLVFGKEGHVDTIKNDIMMASALNNMLYVDVKPTHGTDLWSV